MNTGLKAEKGKRKPWQGKLKQVTRVWKERGTGKLPTYEIELAVCVLTSYLEKENGFIIY
jgi:hypothetical protein